jgi:hypothetical protein
LRQEASPSCATVRILTLEFIFIDILFFGVPFSPTFIFVIFVHVFVIDSIANSPYIHLVYDAGIQTHELLIVNRQP